MVSDAISIKLCVIGVSDPACQYINGGAIIQYWLVVFIHPKDMLAISTNHYVHFSGMVKTRNQINKGFYN